MTNAEYLRQRRAEAVKNGICQECCTRPRDAGSNRCAICLARIREWNARGRVGLGVKRATVADKFCVACAAHGFHRHDCKRAA